MVSVRDIGSIIRFPFELLSSILTFILKHFLEIVILCGAVYFVYWLFKQGVIRKLSNIILQEIEERKVKGGRIKNDETKEEHE